MSGEIYFRKRPGDGYDVHVWPDWDFGIEPKPAGFVLKVGQGRWVAVLLMPRLMAKPEAITLPGLYATRKLAGEAVAAG